MQERQPLHNYFKTTLLTVMGQALDAAGYQLQDRPLQEITGLFRFTKQIADETVANIEFQVLVYSDTAWSAGEKSKFRVTLSRTGNNPVMKTLSSLVVNDFGVGILPSAEYWWQFDDLQSLGNGLAEAGHLVVGYGIPWIEGDLQPPQ